MSGGFYGADVASLRGLADRFDRSAEAIERSAQLLGHSLSATHQWQGPDAGAFRGDWASRYRPQLVASAAALRSAARRVRADADQQEHASRREPSGSATLRTSAPSSRAYEGRVGFGVDRSYGLIHRLGRRDGFESTYGSDGNEVRYTTRDYYRFTTGDAFKLLGFVAAVKGVDGQAAPTASFDLGFEADAGTQFIWRQEVGSTSNELKGLNEIPIQQVTPANFLTGYDASEVIKDIARGRLASPDAVANVSGVKVFAASEIEQGASIFGGSGEVSAERRTEYWNDGRRVDVFTVAGSAGASAGAHIDTRALGAAWDMTAVVGSEASASVATTYGSDGRPETVQYTIMGHAQAGVANNLSVAGGGFAQSDAQGLLVERVLTFDVRDPEVARAVAGSGTAGLIAHSEWATEEVKLFEAATSAADGDAILFDSNADTSNADLIASSKRLPVASPQVQLVDGYRGFHRQVVLDGNGDSQVYWTGEY